MKIKKVIGTGLVGAMLLGGTAFAAEAPKGEMKAVEAELTVESQLAQQVDYQEIQARIIKVTEDNARQFLAVKDKEDKEYTLVLDKDTFLIDELKIKEGKQIRAYYDANQPMLMIYPPQHNVDVVAEQSDKNNIKVAIFDDKLVSEDQKLQIKISDNTEVKNADGSYFKGESLVGKKLAVVYGPATRSILAQTTAETIYVLEKEEIKEEIETPVEMPDVSKMDIVVENKIIKNERAYENKDKKVMVPLRSIAEALGQKVTWDEKTQGIRVGISTSLIVGKDYYTYNKMAPISLGTAPEIKDNRTYVPLDFFTKVMKLNNAYVFENQVVVDNQEKMH